jgi:fibronectin type 3 domain-containing protein
MFHVDNNAMKRLILILSLFLAGYVEAVSLTWDASPPVEQVTSYKVYKVKGNTSTLIGTTTATTFNVDKFTSGARTVFCVTAVNSRGESVQSDKVTIQR